MRAMPLAFPGDPLAGKADNQYMLGDSLLVAAFTRRVYLPEGLWIDYWTGTAYHGPKVVDYDVPNNAGGPLFIRGGAIIPEWPDMEYVGQSSVERLTVRIYPYRSGEFVLIEDDGISFEYENGAAAETRFACESDDVQISIQVFPRQGRYTGIPESRSYELFVRTAGKPIHVAINGETCAELPKKRSGPSSLIDKGWRYDRMEGTVSLCLTDPGESGAPIQIKIASGKLIDKSAANRNLSAERVSRGDSLASVWHSTETGLKIALETRETEKAVALFHTLWSERLGVSPTTDEVREFALSLGGMLAQMIERMGLSVKETLRADYDRLINLQALDTVQSVRELLHGMMDRITEQMILERQTGLHPLVRQTFDLIERELDGPINLHDIAERLHVSPSHLSRLIRKETGKTFSDHVMMRRMEHAKNMLQQGFKVNDVAKALGFEDSSYLAKVFRKYWGVSPSVYKV
jgi:AraC-like DNA-binding protein